VLDYDDLHLLAGSGSGSDVEGKDRENGAKRKVYIDFRDTPGP